MRRIFKKETFLPPKGHCPVCKKIKELSWKKPEVLREFISDRGRILSRARTSLCAKHQRRLASEIKRARYLALFACASKN